MPEESQMRSPSRDEVICPTCGARQRWSDTCRRCKCDLRLFRAVAAAYNRHRWLCLKLLTSGLSRPALQHALHCQRLSPGGESSRLVAICHLLLDQWAEALAASETGTVRADPSTN